MSPIQISINRDQVWNLAGRAAAGTGRVAGVVAAKTAKFTYRTALAGGAFLSPVIGMGIGLYVSRKTGLPVIEAGQSPVISFALAAPLASTGLTYSLARLEAFARTSRMFRNKDLPIRDLNKIEENAKKANEFNSTATSIGIFWSAELTAIITGVAVGAPFGGVPAFLCAAVGAAAGCFAPIAAEGPIKNHLNKHVHANLERFPERQEAAKLGFRGRHLAF